MIVVSENIAGNMHDASAWCNKYRLGRYLRQMDFSGGNYTIVILAMTEEEHEFYQRGMKMKANVPWTMEGMPK